MIPAIYLDRDGVIIQNRADYVRAWDEVSFLPGALPALAEISRWPARVVIVTNQSAVGRGLITLAAAHEINRRFIAAIQAAGGRVDGLYMCPHAPQAHCACRKPRPGLLLQAAQELAIDQGRSVMVGDAWTDVQAGQAAGVSCLVMLRSGRGAAQLLNPPYPEANLPTVTVFDDLAAFANAGFKPPQTA